MHNCNTEQLNKQKEYLKKEILTGTNKDYFKVIDLECGTGKSMTTDEALSTSNKNILLVKQFERDCDSSQNRINKLANKTIALAVHGSFKKKINDEDKFKKIKSNLYKVQILIITHEKYKALAKNKVERKLYTKNREVLVIDEFLNMAVGHELSITVNEINKIESLFVDRTIKRAYQDVTEELYEFMTTNTEKHNFYSFEGDYKQKEKAIDYVIELMKANLNDNFYKSISNDFFYSEKNNEDMDFLNEIYPNENIEVIFSASQKRRRLINSINSLKNFYKQTCVVEFDYLHCVDLDYDYWLLDNNIILDATAKINSAYKLNSIFKVQSQTRVLDHSNFTFLFKLTNTTKSKKEKALNLYENINKCILPETLFIGSKDDEEHVISEHKNHFGNITGSNEYRDLKNVVIGHTPNMPYRNYVLEYLFHSKKKFSVNDRWSGNNKKSNIKQFSEITYRFVNNEFEDYRVCKNAEHIYQAIKRVNRSMIHKSYVIVFCNDSKVIEKVISMFKNVNSINYYDNNVEFEKRTYAKSDKVISYNEQRKENSYATRFIELCRKLLNNEHKELLQEKKNRKKEAITVAGVYSKKKVAEFLECKNAKQNIFNNTDVIKFLEQNNIKNNGQTIDFN